MLTSGLEGFVCLLVCLGFFIWLFGWFFSVLFYFIVFCFSWKGHLILENIILHTQLFEWKILDQFYLQLPKPTFKQGLLQEERAFIKTVKIGGEILPRTTNTEPTYD